MRETSNHSRRDEQKVSEKETDQEETGSTGEEAAEQPLHAFSEFALPKPLLDAISDLEFTHCTPIQSAVLPASLAD